ncbi:MAG: Wzz/FepE/Etk N-terminal domain-containing protein, partial [Anaerolineales bacterium]
MTEQNAQTPDYYENVIDLRQLVKIVLNYKWIIIGVTVIAALVSFLISAFVLSPKYEANAYVTLIEPIITAELEYSIQVSPALPETGALAELAEADAVIDQVAVSLNLLDYIEENKPDMAASLQGESQLHLQVTATDPEIAAQIANGWAQEMVLRINDLYGIGSSTIGVLESEVQKAKDNWNIAQESLETYLPQSQMEILEVQLAEQKNSLARYLNRIEGNRILISDGEVLKSQLADLDKDHKLSTGSALSVIALQQRAAGGISGTQFQFQADQVLGQGYLVEAGKNDIERLIGALKTQNEEFTAELTIIE